MSVYWKRVIDERPARPGDFCYFTDEDMHEIHYGYYDFMGDFGASDRRPVFKKLSNGSYQQFFEIDKFVFWCKPNQINSRWGRE